MVEETNVTGEQLATILIDSVNSGINPEDLCEGVSVEHRQLQQNVFEQVLKPLILSYAARSAFDQRNERSVEECREIVDAMGWYNPYDM